MLTRQKTLLLKLTEVLRIKVQQTFRVQKLVTGSTSDSYSKVPFLPFPTITFRSTVIEPKTFVFYTLATLLGTPVNSNVIQYNSSAINSAFTKTIMFSLSDTVREVVM